MPVDTETFVRSLLGPLQGLAQQEALIPGSVPAETYRWIGLELLGQAQPL